MKSTNNLFFISHNQGVPGSSPGGTTENLSEHLFLGGFIYKRETEKVVNLYMTTVFILFLELQ